jgi:predicted metal-dependent hydrolase
VRDWHAQGRHVTHFFNAMSLLFPDGERFFIDSVRSQRPQIRTPELQQAARAFIGQEAMHGREHSAYNRLLQQAGLPAKRLQRIVAWMLRTQLAWTPAAWRLSLTIALEHFTAILADRLLDDPRMLGGSEPNYRNLWRWHALEETEHKAVAFDVWKEAVGDGPGAHLTRCLGMLAASAAFVLTTALFTLSLAESDPLARRNRRGYLELARFLLGEPGLVRRGIPEWLDYFRRSFHPWQRDNRFLLRRINEIMAEAETGPLRRAAG